MSIKLPSPAGRRELLIADRRDQPATIPVAGAGTRQARLRAGDAETAVTALYRVHAVGLIRLAVVMLGERPAAEVMVLIGEEHRELLTALRRRR